MSREMEHENGYTMEKSGKVGEVKIADDVVATIAGLAATEVEGVASMQGNLTNEIVGKLGVRNLSKGVKIELSEGVVKVELSIMMKYGYSIPETCKAVQDKVKSAIENMTGLQVEYVNIRIVGVNIANRK
ncbi:MAG: Asp23/Gls24 family envelope stress response protein [Lachnospiraceae bacterium]|nr:Asp23/Gls24 family envelope stress response protein [Lachnospiraceae bacterium]